MDWFCFSGIPSNTNSWQRKAFMIVHRSAGLNGKSSSDPPIVRLWSWNTFSKNGITPGWIRCSLIICRLIYILCFSEYSGYLCSWFWRNKKLRAKVKLAECLTVFWDIDAWWHLAMRHMRLWTHTKYLLLIIHCWFELLMRKWTRHRDTVGYLRLWHICFCNNVSLYMWLIKWCHNVQNFLHEQWLKKKKDPSQSSLMIHFRCLVVSVASDILPSSLIFFLICSVWDMFVSSTKEHESTRWGLKTLVSLSSRDVNSRGNEACVWLNSAKTLFIPAGLYGPVGMFVCFSL